LSAGTGSRRLGDAHQSARGVPGPRPGQRSRRSARCRAPSWGSENASSVPGSSRPARG